MRKYTVAVFAVFLFLPMIYAHSIYPEIVGKWYIQGKMYGAYRTSYLGEITIVKKKKAENTYLLSGTYKVAGDSLIAKFKNVEGLYLHGVLLYQFTLSNNLIYWMNPGVRFFRAPDDPLAFARLLYSNPSFSEQKPTLNNHWDTKVDVKGVEKWSKIPPNALKLEFKLDKTTYKEGEKLHFSCDITNVSKSDLVLNFSTKPVYDLHILNAHGEVIWSKFDKIGIALEQHQKELKAGKKWKIHNSFPIQTPKIHRHKSSEAAYLGVGKYTLRFSIAAGIDLEVDRAFEVTKN